MNKIATKKIVACGQKHVFYISSALYTNSYLPDLISVCVLDDSKNRALHFLTVTLVPYM